ncbi:hypothetical protein P8452_37725 [Trifolium repens]|nr:hypothetical protein P8452_37725 [Trifolium repens]
MRESVCDRNPNSLLGLPNRDMPWCRSAVRINMGGRGFWGAKHWGESESWTVVKLRRRKASQPGFRGHNKVDHHRNRDNFHGGYNNGSSDIVTFYFNSIPEGISHVQLRAEIWTVWCTYGCLPCTQT